MVTPLTTAHSVLGLHALPSMIRTASILSKKYRFSRTGWSLAYRRSKNLLDSCQLITLNVFQGGQVLSLDVFDDVAPSGVQFVGEIEFVDHTVEDTLIIANHLLGLESAQLFSSVISSCFIWVM